MRTEIEAEAIVYLNNGKGGLTINVLTFMHDSSSAR